MKYEIAPGEVVPNPYQRLQDGKWRALERKVEKDDPDNATAA